MKRKLITGFAAAAMLSTVAMPAVNKMSITRLQNHTVYAADDVQTAFLKKAARQAQKAAKRYGTYPSVMIAQAVIESDWGRSGLAVEANNLFGMKANADWDGAVYSAKTREEDKNGKSYYITANFRKYNSYEASFDDNGKKLRLGVSWQPDRYEGTWIENAATSAAATKALTGTYATDHKYDSTLNSQISKYDLNKYDPLISNVSKKYAASMNANTYNWPTDHDVATKTDSIKKGEKVTVDKTITYYNGKKRMHIVGKGWVNDTVLTNVKKSLASKTTKEKTKKNLMHTAYIYDSKGKRVKNAKELKEDQVITTYGTKVIKGNKYYQVGKNRYIAAGNVDGTMRLLKHNAYVYNGSGNQDNNLKYKKNKSVATYGSSVEIMGKRYYKIGINQYIKVGNFVK